MSKLDMLIYCTLQMHVQQATYANELHVNVQQRLEGASNILICDHLVSRGKVTSFKPNLTVVSIMCGKHSHDQ